MALARPHHTESSATAMPAAWIAAPVAVTPADGGCGVGHDRDDPCEDPCSELGGGRSADATPWVAAVV